MPWLFNGVHSFELQPLSDRSTKLIQKEVFGGLLSAPVLASIRGETERGFDAMNLALRGRVEANLAVKESQRHA
jgi:hypothetical protein